MRSRFVCLICRNEIAHPGAECPYCKSRASIAEGATPRVLAAIFAVMTLLFVVTGFYTRSFNREGRERGRAHFQSAQALTAFQEYDEAVEHYRDALLYSRDNPEYRLGLALALFESGRYAEAENHLIELRPDDPTSGIVNRLLGRLAAAAGRIDEAVSYYRTAIYGRWGEDAAQVRLRVRFELVDLLDASGRQRQLTTELLELLDIAPDDEAVKRRLAGLLLKAQVADRASALYQELLAANAADHEALVGRAEAEFLLGNYLTARTHFNWALEQAPDEATETRRELCDRIVELDPTLRRIDVRERFRRSRALVERTYAFVEYCRNPLGERLVGPLPAPTESPAEAPLESLAELLNRSRDLLENKIRQLPGDKTIEANIRLAEDLWAARDSACSGIDHDDEPLRLVLAKLSR